MEGKTSAWIENVNKSKKTEILEIKYNFVRKDYDDMKTQINGKDVEIREKEYETRLVERENDTEYSHPRT